ncbi:MAG: signal peptide peptidase SppA [Candidatus Krumholzibacteria bacterium]|nr:signal peptide peptidase SppA [Candidatus Krumholzibacteria bacterium]
MKDFLRMFVASVLALVFLFLVTVAIAGILAKQKPKVESGSYLTIDIYGEILPYNPPDDIVAEILGGEPETLQRILDSLEKAEVDDRLKGVILKISANNTLSGASTEEIRGAIKKVRDSGKKVYAFSDDLNRRALFLASACDSIFMPVTGNVFFAGAGGTLMYFRGLLDKLDIHPNIHKIEDYKSAAESVLRDDMSPEAREMYTWLLEDLWDTAMQAISEDRGVAAEQLAAMMEHALFTAEQARAAGLIDDIRYWDEVDSLLGGDGDGKLRTVTQSEYAEVEPGSLGLKGKKKIAVVHAFGLIGGRHSRVDPMLGIVMGHETLAEELRRVGKDDDVAAVVFRVSSNGGEALTSDLIGHEVEVLSRKKPVVASMVDAAASGGYDISYRATKIVADPMTITGSIGSINGKFNVAGMYNKLGITFDRVSKGSNAFIWSEFQDFTDEQRRRVEENHWDGFNIWLEDISDKRGIAMAELEELAMGRVWTGRQAVENGLVDEIGGLDRAIELAKELADLPTDENVTVVHYPKKKGVLEMIMGGGAPKSAMRWMLYRFIRDDLAESIRLLTSNANLVIE